MIVVLDVVNGLIFAARVDNANTSCDDGTGFENGKINYRDALGGAVHHPLAISGVGILVEVEAGAVGLVADSNNAMTGLGVKPRFRRLRLRQIRRVLRASDYGQHRE